MPWGLQRMQIALPHNSSFTWRASLQGTTKTGGGRGAPTPSLDQGPRQAEPQWLTGRLQSQLRDFLVPDPCECLVGEAGVQAGCWPAD